jgi:hypothetical protein
MTDETYSWCDRHLRTHRIGDPRFDRNASCRLTAGPFTTNAEAVHAHFSQVRERMSR